MQENVFEEKLAQLKDFISRSQFSEIRSLLSTEEAVDIAELFEELTEQNLALVYRVLPKDLASDVFVHLSTDTQETLIRAYSDEELGSVLNGLYNDDLADILEELPASVTQRVLRYTDPGKRDLVNRLLQYPEESAGTIMTTEYVRLEGNLTVAEALEKLRNLKTRVEMIYTCYVTSKDRILEGVISVADILRSPDDAVLSDIMVDDPHYAITTYDQEQVSDMFQRYDLLALPVLDHERRLVGIITVDDALDVLVQETSEDASLMAAVQATVTPYPKTTVWDNAKRRIFWLLLLMLSGTLNGLVLKHFEPVFLALPVLVAFMPMLTSTGGNAASQTNGVVLVAMSMGELGDKNIAEVLFKELRISLLCGTILGLLDAIYIYVAYERDLKLALGIFISFLFTVIMSKCLAAVLPFAAKALKLDPAMVVSPLITTIVDILGLCVYFGIAALLFGIM